jgi:hypothetical protein
MVVGQSMTDFAAMSRRSAVVVVAVGLLAVAVVFFEPWTLWRNTTVVEAPPTASAPAGDEPSEPTELARGTFVSQEHETRGTARVVELADGARVLRLEGFSTSNGPDLHVWLSEKAAGGNWFKYGTGHAVKLGELKANRGSHNYAIPDDADLGRVRSVVIWCRRFFVSFGSAPLDLEDAEALLRRDA